MDSVSPFVWIIGGLILVIGLVVYQPIRSALEHRRWVQDHPQEAADEAKKEAEAKRNEREVKELLRQASRGEI